MVYNETNQLYLEGRLKLSTCASRLGAALFAVCALYLLPVFIDAQELSQELSIEDSAEAEVDPITAAERALPLSDGPAERVVSTPVASTLGILRVLLTLAVVAAAIYGLIFFIKRASRTNRTQDPFLKVLASTPLGANRSVHIVSAGTQAWLVGSAENGVNLIGEIGDKDILNAMLLEDSRRSAEATAGRFPDFKALLGRLGKMPEAGAPGPENIRKRSDRIKGL